MSARPLAKDIIPDKACIGVLGQSLAAAPLGVRVVENLRPVASPDKEQSTEGQHEQVPAYSMCIRTTFAVCIRSGEITGAISRGTLISATSLSFAVRRASAHRVCSR
jgi:hypothetical protein